MPHSYIRRSHILQSLTGHYTGETRRNITFSLPERLIAEFRDDCERHGVRMNQVVQLLINGYLIPTQAGYEAEKPDANCK